MLNNKKPFVPLPQPKQIISREQRMANKQASEIKKRLGVRGKVEAGDLYNKALTQKEKLSIKGLI